MDKKMRYLGGVTNCSVVHDEDRKYPGILLQGDTVFALLSTIKEARKFVETKDHSAANDCLNEVIERLETAIAIYSKTLKSNGYETLPY